MCDDLWFKKAVNFLMEFQENENKKLLEAFTEAKEVVYKGIGISMVFKKLSHTERVSFQNSGEKFKFPLDFHTKNVLIHV